MQWYTQAMKNYVNFSGRARRKEYWMFTLIVTLMSIVTTLLDAVIGMGVLTVLFFVVHFIPSLSVTFRRLHDTGKSGWWILIGLIPVIGGILIIVFMCMNGEDVANKYGENPKVA
jgi:uncharacterized membrane protein YhaH (DUF805 family)